jgi:hypothetical protein
LSTNAAALTRRVFERSAAERGTSTTSCVAEVIVKKGILLNKRDVQED